MLWGIDLGGTKVEGVVLDPDRLSEPVARLRVPTESSKGYGHLLGQITKVVELLESETGLTRPKRIGMGTPGARDPDSGLMKNCNSTVLNGRTLLEDSERALGAKVTMANDANCFALAESKLGCALGYGTVFGVIMGTGVGAGIVVDGKVLMGRHSIAGEWGHNVLEEGGTPCYCGKRGCVETVLSGPGLERYFESISARNLPLADIAALEEEGDPHAVQTIDRLCTMFGRAIGTVINVLDPDVVVLGGGVGNVERVCARARECAAPWVITPTLHTEFRRPTLGDSAGVFGAAMLVA